MTEAEILKMVEDWPVVDWNIVEFAYAIRRAALEEAAKICDSVNNFNNPMTATDCADAIRALANQKEG